jgi:molecular chaperone DnaK
MANLKINYGIDLGTTNSAIARMQAGVPVIQKIETTDDIMPSCIYFQKNKSYHVGKKAYNSMKSDKRRAMKKMSIDSSNTFLEFKRTMGTDKKYLSSNMNQEYTSEELSAEILKGLKSFIADDDFRSAIITVPAKFTVNQKTATIEAAKLAGFNHVELLQEPIAAAMAYGLAASQKDGYWLVFDFGGGTFDAALIKVEDGIIQVFDTEGDNYLGGKNLDYAIVDEILVPYLKENYSINESLADPNKKGIIRDALKTYAEEIKNELSFKDEGSFDVDNGDLGEDEDGEEYEISYTVTREQVFDVMRPHFQKAVDICKDLLKRNNLTGDQLGKLILVGGPTHSPLIRQMLKEQITSKIDTSLNPMTVVAIGAALYASTIDNEIKEEELKAQDVVLDISFESMTVDTDLWIPVSLKSGASSVMVQFVRHDNAWDSGKIEIDAKGNAVELNLLEGIPNSFRVECFDKQGNKLKSFPEEITIIQGSKVGSATLPYDISLGVDDNDRDKIVTYCVRGLERNKTLPATGVANGLHTTVQVRPGVETDVIKIPIYQADNNGNDMSVALFEYVGEIQISGDDVDTAIPMNANVDITVKVDRNEQMTVEAYFPDQDVSVSKQIDTSKKQSISDAESFTKEYIPQAKQSIDSLKKEGRDVSEIEQQLKQVEEEHANSSESKMVMQHLKEVLRKIEDYEKKTGWERAEAKLRFEFGDLEKLNAKQGNKETTAIINSLREQVDNVIRKKDVKLAHELTDTIIGVYIEMDLVNQCKYRLAKLNRDFDNIRWKDRARARQLINQGAAELSNQPTGERMRQIVIALENLMPEDQRPKTGIGK